MRQAALFDDEAATRAGLPALAPVIRGGARALSAAQRRFNALLERIGKLRVERERWQSFAHTQAQRVISELAPRARRLREEQTALARLFDDHLARTALGKRHRELLREMLLTLIAELLEDEETPELIALHDRHADVSRAEAQRLDFELLRVVATGLPVDVDAYEGEPSREAFSDWVDQQLGAAAARRRSGSTKSRGRERAAAATAESGTRTLRMVFRRLASTLHPDRESDPHEQRRKTLLMQELNAAYSAGDLLRVLELQHSVDARAADVLAGLSDGELKPYIGLLEQQAKRLREEIDALIAPFAEVFPGRAPLSLTPAGVLRAFEQALAELEQARRATAAELARFADARGLKEALREIERAERTKRPLRDPTRRGGHRHRG